MDYTLENKEIMFISIIAFRLMLLDKNNPQLNTAEGCAY